MDRYDALVVVFLLIVQRPLARVLGVPHTLGLVHGRELAGLEVAAEAAAVAKRKWAERSVSVGSAWG